ncbi:hypothetical protein ACJ72_05728 [Emergomyces africanus]|uniref:Secreted protein n=1 Tax=Emergomyces africanus TaxID=1955775 RepID=A0A1B7NT38_9EURO|nr:hypothetical protein ACJ72_05728 [Emergomyces africanus]
MGWANAGVLLATTPMPVWALVHNIRCATCIEAYHFVIHTPMSAVWQSHRGFIHESKMKENAKYNSFSGPIIHAGFSKGRSKVGIKSSKLGLSSSQHRPEGFPCTVNQHSYQPKPFPNPPDTPGSSTGKLLHSLPQLIRQGSWG